jgi:drug/metabolite transporter (DMT)-like permease
VVQRERSGFLLAAGAALLYGANQPASQVLITGPLGARYMVTSRLAALAVAFLAVALARHGEHLRLRRRELATLAVFGLVGLAAMQWAVTEAIARLDVGIVILCVYSGPFLIALWCRVVRREPMPVVVWLAIAGGMTGLALAVGLIGGHVGRLSLGGLAFAALAGCGFAYYALHADALLRTRPAPVVLGSAALVALVVWSALAARPEDFPAGRLSADVHLAGLTGPGWALLALSLTAGTALPYMMVLGGISRIGPTPTTIAGMIEPVLAVLLSWAWLDQGLTALQLVGAVAVLAAVLVVQRARAGEVVPAG